MQTRPRGRPSTFERSDRNHIAIAIAHVREKRARSQAEAFRLVAYDAGIYDECHQRTFIERLRRRRLRDDRNINPPQEKITNEKLKSDQRSISS